MSDLRITTIQSKIHWENIDANLEMFAQKLTPLHRQTDVIVLPEMFSTGFTMIAAPVAEPMDGKTVVWMREQAIASGAVVTGSFIAIEDGLFFNRLVWMRPDGTYDIYDKRHLYTPAEEHLTYTAGHQKLITEWKGWKICPLICYDLRFPVWSRNVEGYDLLIYMANWPKPRNHHWKQLLIARAIENQSYAVGVNLIGKDGNGLEYTGDTSVVDFSGELLYRTSNVEAVFTTILSLKKVQEFRQRLNFLPDRDFFEIK